MPFIPPKGDRDSGFPGFDQDFFELLKNLLPDTIPTGWPRYRRGGSPRNWSTPGGNKYVDPSGFVQVGCERRSWDPAISGSTEDFIFPTAYSGKPIVLCVIGEMSTNSITVHYHAYDATKTQFTVWWGASGGTLYWIDFNWIAFGPGAG